MVVKKAFLSLLAGLLFLGTAMPQSISIREARNLGAGANVTVSGVVTNGDELGYVRYIQDQSAGLAIYDESKLGGFGPGDSVSVSGTLSDYNGLLEIQPVTSIELKKQGAALPEALDLKPSQLSEEYEGMLIRIRSASFSMAGSLFAGRTNYTFTASGESGQIRISDDSSPFVGQEIPSGNNDITGILSQYQADYQVLVRLEDDIQASGGISMTVLPRLSEISTDGMTLSWETDLEGSTEILYGRTPELELGRKSEEGLRTDHSIRIEGTEASELYYVRAFSVLDGDTAISTTGMHMSASGSGGEIRAYFNRTVDHSLAYATPATVLAQAMDDSIIALMDRASESIDFCAFNLNNDGISDISGALNSAYKRGVRVRVIYDSNQGNAGIPELEQGIGKIGSPTSSYPEYGIMHNKFVVIDAHAADPDLPYVWTGSTNFTPDQINIDPNNVVLVQDRSLALAYEMEFNEMFGSDGPQPNAEASRFGPDKSDNTPHEFSIGGIRVEAWFSPSDNTQARLLETLESADHEICAATMLITRPELAKAIVTRKQAGARSRIVVRDLESCDDEVVRILGNGLEDDFRYSGETGMMHHKYLVVDQGYGDSDPLVWTGSHNWSASADVRNDENTLVIHDRDLANQFYQEFSRRFESGLVSTPPASIASMQTFTLYPNPAIEQFWIRSNMSGNFNCRIIDLSGKCHRDYSAVFAAGESKVFDTSDLSSGYYIVQINVQEGYTYFLRLVIPE